MHSVVLKKWTWLTYGVVVLACVASILWSRFAATPIPAGGLTQYVDNPVVTIPLLVLLLVCAIPLALPRARTVPAIATVSGCLLCAGLALMFYVGGGMGMLCIVLAGSLGNDVRAAYDRLVGAPLEPVLHGPAARES